MALGIGCAITGAAAWIAGPILIRHTVPASLVVIVGGALVMAGIALYAGAYRRSRSRYYTSGEPPRTAGGKAAQPAREIR